MEEDIQKFEYSYNKNNDKFQIVVIPEKEKNEIAINIKSNDGSQEGNYSSSFTLDIFKQKHNYFSLFSEIDELFIFIKQIIQDNNLKIERKDNDLLFKLIFRGTIKMESTSLIINKVPENPKNQVNKIIISVDNLTNEVSLLKNEIKELKNDNSKLVEQVIKLRESNENLTNIIQQLVTKFDKINKNKENEARVNSVNENKIKNNIDDFSNSKILTNKENIVFVKELVQSKINKYKFQLIYSAKINGDKWTDFYNYCREKTPTILIVKTTGNKILGGITEAIWNDKVANYSYLKGKNTFLFNLNNKMIYQIKDEKAIFFQKGFSAIISGDFVINDKCLTNSSWVPYKQIEVDKNYDLNDGEQYFGISELEVYLIT